jgi:hypothetical protein
MLTRSFSTNNLAFKLVRPSILTEFNFSRVDPLAQTVIAAMNKAMGETKVETLGKTKLEAFFTTAVCVAKAAVTKEACAESSSSGKSLENHIQTQPGLTALLYEVKENLKSQTLSFNAKTLLVDSPILNFLFLYGYNVQGFKDAAAISRWMVDEGEGGGVHRVYAPLVEIAAISMVEKERIEVGNKTALLGFVGNEIKSAAYSFIEGVFSKSLKKAINRFVYDKSSLGLIEEAAAALGVTLSTEDTDYLVNYINASNINIDELTQSNAEHFITYALMEYKSKSIGTITPTGGTKQLQDYSVNYYEERFDALAVNAENINAAAQLFYVMTLADELGLINAADLLITKYLAGGQVDVRSPETLKNLQRYAFSDEFIDVRTGAAYKRTEEEERRMFYRQVFNMGDGELTQNAIYNNEFDKVWNNLLTEVVQYITKLSTSENPTSYVSRQYVAQAVDDLRYNLSTYCTGMSKVISPIINMELDFIIQKFYKDEEIIRQLALHNSRSFWKVPERILQDQYGHSVNLSSMLNKARYGHSLISKLATFTESSIEDDAVFSDFVSTVEAFVIASSQVSEQTPTEQEGEYYSESPAQIPGVDDWNF